MASAQALWRSPTESSEPSASLLHLDDIHVTFGDVTAVQGLTLTIEAGEFLTLLGPSGCGKTTTLRVIAGYVIPSSGDVYLDGNCVTTVPPQKRRIGMVFQHYALFPHMSVAQNVAFGIRLQHRPRSEVETRIQAMLRLVRLEGYGSRRPRELSGGQQQRIALARALAFEPRLLLLDEPLGALDLRLREAMQTELKRIQRETAITTVYVTHDQGEALTLSDRVVVMNHGRIEQVGRPEDIYERPRTAFVADFVGKINLFDANVIERRSGELALQLDGTSVHCPAPDNGDLRPGDSCKLAIRPEYVSLNQVSGGDAPLDGQVESIQYLGTHELVSVKTNCGLAVLVQERERRCALGDRVSVHWPSDRSLVLDS